MSEPNVGPRLMPSLLDRLSDPESGGSGVAAGYSEDQMREAVKRDLADLLNAKLGDPAVARGCPAAPRPGERPRPACYGTGLRAGPVCSACCPELGRSVVGYGLPDLTTYDATDEGRCWDIARLIERVIATHEPRLRGVRVTVPRQAFDAVTRELHFQVEAALDVGPAALPVGFATVLELISGQAKIDPPAGRKPA